MNAGNNENSALAWSQIIIVILLAAGALWVQIPLRSERPDPSGAGVKTGAQQNIDTRLWQDPFETVIKARTELPQTGAILSVQVEAASSGNTLRLAKHKVPYTQEPSFKHLRKQIDGADGQDIGIFIVMVPGGNWVPADEGRRRTRYAVLAGLNVKCFVPSDPEHIGYVVDNIKGEQFVFPYEWLERRTPSRPSITGGCLNNRWKRILVVWLDEDTLLKKSECRETNTDINNREKREDLCDPCRQSGPISRVLEIADRLGVVKSPSSPALAIIGPSSSQFLIEACQERKCDTKNSERARLDQLKIHWYSPWASLPDNKLRQLCDDNTLNRCNLLPRFYQILPTDDILIDYLVRELELRRYGQGDTVVLVGQWDTEYARSLRDLLQEKILEAETRRGGDKTTRKRIPKLIMVSFLRGLDARIPDASKDKKEKLEPSSPASIERPEGNSQIDYLRRLAVDLNLRQRHTGRIGAIGILGNDYYDKLLVLQALRPMFPDAIFFTTDLDAAMLHRSDNRYTRNLIVASGFGLNLNQKYQNDIPPFRDVYQTAAFLATQTAIELANQHIDIGDHSAATEVVSTPFQEPGIYEIGRSMAIKLDEATQNICTGHTAILSSTLPMSTLQLRSPVVMKIFGPALGLLVLWLVLTTAGLARRKNLYIWLTLLACAIILPALLYFFGAFDVAEGGEPIYWLQGISIWPSEIVRAIAFFIALLLIRKGVRELRFCRERLSLEFGFVRIDDTSTFGNQCMVVLRRNLRGMSIGSLRQTASACARRIHLLWKEIVRPNVSCSPPSLNASEIWQAYNREIHPAWAPFYLRFHPALLFALFVLSLLGYFWLLTNMLDLPLPVTPARGDVAFVVDRIIISSAVLAFLALLFFALYEACRATWLCQILNRQTQWSFKNNVESTSGIGALPEPWHDVRFIALATEPVQNILFYPFIVLVLLIVARSTLFDRWHIPIVLWAIFLLVIFLVVIAALRLRIHAEHTRKLALLEIERLTERSLSHGLLDEMTKYKTLQEQIRILRTGVFAAFSQQPLVKAMLALAGSYSGLTLLEFLNTSNL